MRWYPPLPLSTAALLTTSASPSSGKHLAGAAAAALGLLLALAPFEPRVPVVPVAGTELTLLELAAALTCALWLAAGRRRLPDLVRRPPLPLAFLFAYAAAQALSATLAPAFRDSALRFAVRMAGVALIALATALAPPAAHRRALQALAATTGLVAALAVGEVLGLAGLDPVLDAFRDSLVVVGGARRATAGSAHPNLAGAFLAYGLVAGVAALGARARPLRASLPFAALLSLGLVATYSRGALGAAAAGLLVLAALAPAPRRRVALLALGVLAAVGTASLLAPAVRLRARAEGTTSWYAVHIAPADRHLVLGPGESRSVELAVTNLGRLGWRGRSGFSPAYTLHDPATGARLAEVLQPALEHDVPPGATRTLVARVNAPAARGRYVLRWDMVHVYAGYFARHGSPPAAVWLDVTPRGTALPAPEGPPPPLLAAPEPPPTRRELWRAALALWAERPLVGAGPDSFRRLYGRVLGRAGADPRTYANSTFLEAAATTGLLGALALLGTLAATLRAAVVARAAAAAPALGALGTVLAVHGLVDYVLAFTGHALVLAFVVGATSALHLPDRASS